MLLDVRLRGASGLDLCRQIRAAGAGLQGRLPHRLRRRAVPLPGASRRRGRLLLKRIRGGELVDTCGRICDGEVLIDPALAGRVALSAARLHSGEFWPGAHLGLTQRESEVLSLLVAGLSNRAIAAKLVVSEETVKTHSRASTASSGCPTGPPRSPWRCVRESSTDRARLAGADAEREAQLLSRVIETISAGLDLDRILQGVAKLVTETTGHRRLLRAPARRAGPHAAAARRHAAV